MRYTPLLAAAALALVATPAPAQPVTLTPQQVAQIFCISRIGNDMAPVEGLLTVGLRSAIADAELRNASIGQERPGDKPPLGDGIPWQAMPDRADQCRPGPVAFMMDAANVGIDYSFRAYPEADFSDTLALRLVDNPAGTRVCRIDNILYAGNGDLQATLADAFLD